MDNTKADNLDRYKSYIQRRRVGSSETKHDLVAVQEVKDERTEASYSDSYADAYKAFQNFSQQREKTGTEDSKTTDEMKETLEDAFKTIDTEDTSKDYYTQRNQTAAPHKTDSGLYRKLYGQYGKGSHTSSYAGAYHGYGSSGNTEIKDNRATVLAVKIIKQSIACFVILGIIVLLQQRSEMTGVLEFIRKNLVDNHIEPQSILTGVENIVKECSRFLGGSP